MNLIEENVEHIGQEDHKELSNEIQAPQLKNIKEIIFERYWTFINNNCGNFIGDLKFFNNKISIYYQNSVSCVKQPTIDTYFKEINWFLATLTLFKSVFGTIFFFLLTTCINKNNKIPIRWSNFLKNLRFN